MGCKWVSVIRSHQLRQAKLEMNLYSDCTIRLQKGKVPALLAVNRELNVTLSLGILRGSGASPWRNASLKAP